ncbi:MAG TPA: YMGG-like glycine zipper-containing protein [Gemmatimonadaceae bacterium]|nr:YMGG-like glycine zipper-containing protein [Gemmatimonadaceae bacterium]
MKYSRLLIVRQSRRGSLLLAAIALAAGCARHDAPTVDSALARDLSMAGQTVPDFTPADTALNPNAKVRVTAKAPTVKTSAPKPVARPRPATATRVANVPRPEAPSPTVHSSAPAAVPEESPTAAGSTGRGLAGTAMAFNTASAVCTSNRVGDKLVAHVSQTSGPGAGTIPAGSTVVLEVADMQVDNAHPEQSRIVFRIRAISANGVDYPGNGTTVTADGGLKKINTTPASSDAKKAAAGAIAGAILGQVIGHNTKGTVIGAAAGGVAGAVAGRATRQYEGCLPAGTALRVTLNAA